VYGVVVYKLYKAQFYILLNLSISYLDLAYHSTNRRVYKLTMFNKMLLLKGFKFFVNLLILFNFQRNFGDTRKLSTNYITGKKFEVKIRNAQFGDLEAVADLCSETFDGT
jgi:hypothetical protein